MYECDLKYIIIIFIVNYYYFFDYGVLWLKNSIFNKQIAKYYILYSSVRKQTR